MDSLAAQIRQLAQTTTDDADASRRKILDTLTQLHYEIETPFDTLMRLKAYPLHLPLARIAIDLGIFGILSDGEEGQSVDVRTLAERTGAAEGLLGRLLRTLASLGMIRETAVDHFAANKMTRLLTEKAGEGVVYVSFVTLTPICQALPSFLAEHGYNYPDENDNTAHAQHRTVFQTVFHTDLPVFEWLKTQPDQLERFAWMMTAQRNVDWLTVFPLEKQLGDWIGNKDPAKVLFVDVGGGLGHQCVGLRRRFPRETLPGRVILQDLREQLDRVDIHQMQTEGVEMMPCDFFTEQPVKGAKFYYLRMILHDYDDDRCMRILSNLLPAMAPHSCILIDEMVLPDQGVHWQAAAEDLRMMAVHGGGRERTRRQWKVLMDRVGLRILETYLYIPGLCNSVMVVVKEDPVGIEGNAE